MTGVQISRTSHLLLKEIIKRRKERDERANHGLIVEQLILKEAIKEKINVKKILSASIHV